MALPKKTLNNPQAMNRPLSKPRSKEFRRRQYISTLMRNDAATGFRKRSNIDKDSTLQRPGNMTPLTVYSAFTKVYKLSTCLMLGMLLLTAGCDKTALVKHAAPSPSTNAQGQSPSRAAIYQQVQHLTALGRQLFSDPTLSGSGKLACASCHSPAYAFGPPNSRSVQLGGANMLREGLRAAPSLKYLQTIPQFTEHYYDADDEADGSIDNGPTGGLTWDGRVDQGGEQARLPLTSPLEMASTPAKVAAAVRRAPYAAEFEATFGKTIWDDDEQVFRAVLQAFEVFEQSQADFYPYSSKYDAYLAGQAQLTPAELRGLQLFNDEDKGNCASCHLSQPAKNGTPPQFTDYGLIALGVPRNRALSVNQDPNFYDLGACGPERTDLKDRVEYCGLFRTPSLRNVALRSSFFHNGLVHTLAEAVRFYSERDTQPEKWYPRNAHGELVKFDDLPKRYHANLNFDPPFGGKPGDQPALNESEIQDIVTFLKTLTDGYQPTSQNHNKTDRPL